MADELDCLDLAGIPGLKVRELLTFHTLTDRVRTDPDRWSSLEASSKAIAHGADWRSVLTAATRSSGARTGASSKSTTGCPTRGLWVRASGRRNDSRSTSCADPTVLLPPDADRAEKALTFDGSPCPVDHSGQLSDGLIAHDDAAVQVIQVVETLGLPPVQPAPRREPITKDDVGVVCWMAVLPPRLL